MCIDPITLSIGVGLMAAGTAAQMAGQEKAHEARADAISAETGRQNTMADEARAIFGNSVDQASEPAVTKSMSKKADDRTALYEGAVARGTPLAMPNADTTGAAPVLRNAAVASDIDRTGLLKNIVAQMANLNSFGDASTDVGIGLGKNRMAQSVISDKSRGSMRLLSTDLASAGEKGKSLRMLGDLLAGGGQMAMGGAFGNMGAGGMQTAGKGPMNPMMRGNI